MDRRKRRKSGSWRGGRGGGIEGVRGKRKKRRKGRRGGWRVEERGGRDILRYIILEVKMNRIF